MSNEEYPKRGTPEYDIQRDAFYGEIDALIAEVYRQRRPLTVNYFHEKCKTKAHTPQAWGALPQRPYFRQHFVSSSDIPGLIAEQARAKAKNYTSHGHQVNIYYPRSAPSASTIDVDSLNRAVV